MLRLVLSFLTSVLLLSAQTTPTTPAPEVHQIPEPGRFKNLFRPFRTDNAAISPDGKYLAYSVREGESLFVIVIEIDHPEKITARVEVGTDEGATPMLALKQTERTPARINWLGWTTPTRLLAEINLVLPQATGGDRWINWRGTVVAFDADGGNAKVLVTPKNVEEFDLSTVAGAPSAAQTVSLNPASTGRPNDQRQGRTANASQPAADNSTLNVPLPEAVFAAPDMPLPDVRLAAPVLDGAPHLRTVRILDFDPARPGSVLVVATGSPQPNETLSLGLYSLDGKTGKLKILGDEPVARDQDMLLDRQGRVRLTVPNAMRAGFPFKYEYLGEKGTDRAKLLDQVTGLVGFSVSPANYFGERAIPLGFDEDPAVLYYASNTGRDTFGIYSLNLTTKQRSHLAMENTEYDMVETSEAGFPDRNLLVFDRYKRQLTGVRFEGAFGTTAWTRPDLQDMQAGFEKTFPGRSVKISDWDQAGQRFVVSTEGPSDPGAFFIYDGQKKKLLEFVRRAPWVDAAESNPTTSFAFQTVEGVRLSGLITAPRHPRLKPIPMVVLCPDLPWQRVRSEFQAEVQALADMGFVVVQLNGRGAWGFGLKQRQSLTAGYDQAQVEDIVATVAAIGQRFQVNAGRVALMGRGHGGFIALRALQDHPDKFRCAIALDAPVNLGDWIAEQRWEDGDASMQLTRAWFGDAGRLKAAPLVSSPSTLTKPVLMLNYPGPRVGQRRLAFTAASQFAEKVRSQGTALEFGELSTDYMNGLPVARAALFDRIEEFLNLHIYDFKVKLNETQMIK